MADAPLVSTIIAIGIIPVAFLFVHAFLSGLKGWRFHNLTGPVAIVWDLSLSIGYMISRALGLDIGGSSLELKGAILAYFIIHGTVSAIVIMIEFTVLGTGIYNWKSQKKTVWHKRLSKVLFVIWWFSFLSGEIFYVVNYVM
jgi:hypothetical protein